MSGLVQDSRTPQSSRTATWCWVNLITDDGDDGHNDDDDDNDDDDAGGGGGATNSDTPSCRQKRQTRWRATKKDADATSDRQKRRTTWRATNSGCWYGIVLSEKTNTLACNQLRMLTRHRAVRKDKHGGVQQKRMLMQHRTVKKNEQLGVQRIPDADTASCCQKRQTHWRATNYGCWRAIVQSEKTNTVACNKKGCWCNIGPSKKTNNLACNEFRMLIRHRAVRKDKNAAATPGCYGIGLIYSPQTQPSIGCTSDSKIIRRDSSSKMQPPQLQPTFIYLSIYLI